MYVFRSFEADGFLIHPDPVLNADQLTAARRGLEQVRDGVYDTGEDPDGRNAPPGEKLESLCKIEQPQLASRALREILQSPRLGEVLAQVTDARRVQAWWVQGLYKPGLTSPTATGSNVGWHQDKTYWDAWDESSELFTAWLALSDVTAESGPMVFVPRSHKWGLLPGGNFFAQDQDVIRSQIPLPAGETWTEVVDILPPGGVSLHHQLLFHGSHQNVSPSPRMSLAIHLRTENSNPKPGSWVTKCLDRPEICPFLLDRA